jgi:hypothetical protein
LIYWRIGLHNVIEIMNTNRFFGIVLTVFVSFIFLLLPSNVSADNYGFGITVCPVCQWINVEGGAPAGTPVTLSIDDPSNGTGVDYTTSSIFSLEDNQINTGAKFELPDFSLRPGFLVTASTDLLSKTMTVSPFAVTEVNLSSDTVSGVATPGVQVDLFIGVGASGTRSVVADSVTGVWTANFSVPGNPPNNTIADFLPGVGGGASEKRDVNGNTTWTDWNWDGVPLIQVNTSEQYIVARNFPVDSNVTLTIDDPSNGVEADYTFETAVQHDQYDLYRSWTGFPWPSIGLQPGFVVTVSGGGFTKTLVVPHLTMSSVNTQADTITGITEPNALMQVCVSDTDNYCVRRDVIAESTGSFIANYHIPGVHPDDQQTYNLISGTYGWATVSDVDSDVMIVDWQATAAPQITSLSPARVWIGLQNSQDKGIKYDLLAEAYKDGILFSSGELDSVDAGGAGFNHANLNTIDFNYFSPIDFPEGSQLSVKLYVRNSCHGSKNNGKTARLWYNDLDANSSFGVTIDSVTSNYYLTANSLLSSSVGLGPKQTQDVNTKKECAPFSLFGAWAITP